MKKYHVLDYQDCSLTQEVKDDIRKFGLAYEWSEGLHYYGVEGVEPSKEYKFLDQYILSTLGINEDIIIDYWW